MESGAPEQTARKTDVLIVGGGLSGLSLARELARLGTDFLLIEARERLGGRILSTMVSPGPETASFDLGPAWFWPGQPKIANLLEELGIEAFEQYARGDALAEDETGRRFRGRGLASMAGAFRPAGGFSSIVERIARDIPSEQLLMARKVVRVRRLESGLRTLSLDGSGAGVDIESRSVIFAIPPRLVAGGLDFEPALDRDVLDALRNIPTWMAGHAKLLAIYERPFWREAGLSGNAMSRLGPLMEIHDAPPTGGPYALFGFCGVSATDRAGKQEELLLQTRAQLARLFGAEGAHPLHLAFQDWATEPFTSSELDREPLLAHPRYGLPRSLEQVWGGRLQFASTETAQFSGGLLEGALEAAERLAATLGSAQRVQKSLSVR
jgi:monoamine oxidase